MTSELKRALLQWWEKRPLKHSAYVFTCLDNIPCLGERYGKPFVCRSKFMRRICKKAGVKPFGFHSIRHLTASILYHKGCDTSLIQAVLRHKNPTTTNRYLQKMGLEHVRKGLEEGLRGPAKIIDLVERKVVRRSN
jgi:integrase